MCMWVPVFLDAEMLDCPEAGVGGTYRPLVSNVGDWNQEQCVGHISSPYMGPFVLCL